MRYFSEKRAEQFLEKEGFNVVERMYLKKKIALKKALIKVGFPFVMKVGGEKIVHKKEIGGVKLGIQTYSDALEEFSVLKKIKKSNGIMVQKTLSGKEFLLGVKKTKEFGHVILFGAGGSDVERKKDIVFRVAPLEESEIRKMIKLTKISKELLKKDKLILERNILKICDLVKKYPKIYEMDINPLIVNAGKATIVDARIVWE